jgi:glycerophosphoryl diester phosphodiesterase
MTTIAQHKLHIQEHMQELTDALTLGIENRPATISLHASACSISLLEAYLHALGKISIGAMIKHEWFKEPKIGQKILPLAERKLGVDFPRKQEILSLMYAIEEHRNKLIYGKPTKETATVLLSSFQKLHQIIKEEMQTLGEEIE